MTARNEPKYLQVRLRRPSSLWPVARLLSVSAVAALCVTLLTAPATGLLVFWDLVVPVLPALFLVAPGLWRNVCPMAAANQVPRVLGLTRGFELPRVLVRHGYAIALALFFALVLARGAVFETDPRALAALLAGAVVAALAAGVVFKGKSGFCGGVCPLRPVQGLYGQTPFAEVPTSHCRPCLGCTPNCSDLKPRTAFLDDLRDADPRRGAYRKLFAGSFPGFILAFYTLPGGGAAGAGASAARFAVLTLASLGAFFVVDALSRPRLGLAPALWGALAFNAFYWFNVPAVAAAAGRLAGGPAPEWVVWEGRALALGLSAAWLVRTLRKE
nr:hypothetical protein [Actinomycetota bacterium]